MRKRKVRVVERDDVALVRLTRLYSRLFTSCIVFFVFSVIWSVAIMESSWGYKFSPTLNLLIGIGFVIALHIIDATVQLNKVERRLGKEKVTEILTSKGLRKA